VFATVQTNKMHAQPYIDNSVFNIPKTATCFGPHWPIMRQCTVT